MDPNQISLSLQVVTGLMVILAFIFWIFSAKTWRWHMLTMVVLNFFAAAGFTYLAMRAMKTQTEWRNKDLDLQKRSVVEEEGDQAKGTLGISQLELETHQRKHDLDRVTLQRGRVWRELGVKSRQGLELTLEWKGTEPPGITPKSVLFLFDDKRVGMVEPHYLGEFKVTNVADRSITLVFAAPSSQKEREDILNSSETIVAYETMPVDDPDAYLDGKEDAVRDALVAKLPAKVQEELKNKDRNLRDYTYAFDDIRRQITIAKAEIDQTGREIEALKLAKTQAGAAITAEAAEGKALAVDLARFKQEHGAIADYVVKLEAKTKELIGQLNTTFKQNREMADKIVSANAKALDALNRSSTPSDEPAKKPESQTDNKAAASLLKAP